MIFFFNCIDIFTIVVIYYDAYGNMPFNIYSTVVEIIRLLMLLEV